MKKFCEGQHLLVSKHGMDAEMRPFSFIHQLLSYLNYLGPKVVEFFYPCTKVRIRLLHRSYHIKTIIYGSPFIGIESGYRYFPNAVKDKSFYDENLFHSWSAISKDTDGIDADLELLPPGGADGHKCRLDGGPDYGVAVRIHIRVPPLPEVVTGEDEPLAVLGLHDFVLVHC